MCDKYDCKSPDNPCIKNKNAGKCVKSCGKCVKSCGKCHFIPANVNTIQWGFFYKNLESVVKINSGDTCKIEVLTHHAGDDYDKMIKGDKKYGSYI